MDGGSGNYKILVFLCSSKYSLYLYAYLKIAVLWHHQDGLQNELMCQIGTWLLWGRVWVIWIGENEKAVHQLTFQNV